MSKALLMEYNKGTGGTLMPNIYNVIIRPCTDTKGYRAECNTPNGGCVAQAKTIAMAKQEIADAIAFYMEDYPNEKYQLKFEVLYA